MKGIEKIGQQLLFSQSHNTEIMGQLMKLKGGKFKTDKKNFFTQCVIRRWNSLTIGCHLGQENIKIQRRAGCLYKQQEHSKLLQLMLTKEYWKGDKITFQVLN